MSTLASVGADVEGIEKLVAAAKKEVAAAENKVAAAKKEVAAAENKVAAAENKVAAAKKEVAAAKKEVAAAETEDDKEVAKKMLKIAVAALETAQKGLDTSEEERESQVSVLHALNDTLNQLRREALQVHQALGATPTGGAQAASGQVTSGVQVAGEQGHHQNLLCVLKELSDKVGKVDDRVGKVDDRVGKVDDRVGKVDEEVRHVRQRIESDQTSEAISEYPVEKYQRLFEELQLSLLVVQAPDDAPQIGSGNMSLFKWDERTEPQQIEDCLSFLKDHLKIPRCCVLRAIDKWVGFLSVHSKSLGTTVGIRGTSDLAVLDRGFDSALTPRAGIIVLLELKKDPQPKDVRQAHLELIAACRISQFRAVVVLTDLRESWRFYWIKDKDLCMMSIRSASQAFNIMDQLFASHSDPQRDVSAVLPQLLINRTQLRAAQEPANVSPQHEDDDYQMDLLTQGEQMEVDRKRVMLFAAEHIPWMMYS